MFNPLSTTRPTAALLLLCGLAACANGASGPGAPDAGSPGAPATPAHLRYTGSGGHDLNLCWDDPADGGLAYDLQRADAPAGPFAQVAATVATSHCRSDGPFPYGSPAYYYEVRARSDAGASAWSAPVAAGVGPEPIRSFYAGTGSDQAIFVSWVASPEAVSYDVYKGDLYVGDAGYLGNTDASGYLDTAVATGDTAIYSVRPVSDAGFPGLFTTSDSLRAVGVTLAGQTTWVSDTGAVAQPQQPCELLLVKPGSLSGACADLPGGGGVIGVDPGSYDYGDFLSQTQTAARVVDLSLAIPGRSDAVAADGGATLAVALSGFDAGFAQPDLEAVSLGAGSDSPVQPGYRYDDIWPFQLEKLIDGAKGDRLVVLLRESRQAFFGPYQVVTQGYSAPSFTMAQGTTTPVTGMLAPAAQSTLPSLHYATAAFNAFAPVSNYSPTYSPEHELAITASPGLSQYGRLAGLHPRLLTATFVDDGNFGKVLLGNPFPPSWELSLETRARALVNINTQSAGVVLVRLPFAACADKLTTFDLSAVAPRITPPLSLQVTSGPGLHTVTWQPPASGTPTSYVVDWYDVDAYGALEHYRREVVQGLQSALDLSQSGRTDPVLYSWLVAVSARISDDTPFATPLRSPVLDCSATAWSSPFSP